MELQDDRPGVVDWWLGMYWPPRTLKAQFLVYGAVAVLLAAGITAFLYVRFAEAEARRQAQAQMLHTAVALAAAVERAGPAEAQELFAAFHRAAGTEAGYQIVMVDLDGHIVAATNRQDVGKPIVEVMGHPEPDMQQVLAGGHPLALEETREQGRPVLDVTLPLHGEPADPGRITGALHIAMPHHVLTPLVWRLLTTFGLSALLLAVLLIAPLWLYLERSLLRPMRALAAANEAVARGGSEGRMIPADAMPAHELGQVMRSRNLMLARLDAADAELRRRLKELSALNSTAALLSESVALEELLEETLDKVLEITGMDAGEISLFEPEEKRLVVRAHRGFSAGWLADEADRPTTCLCGEVVHQEEPLCLPDISQDDGRATRLACVREGFRGFCAVPLQAEGQVLGVMSLHSRHVRRPSPQARDLLAAIGSQVAVALMNVRLYAETQRLATTDPLTGLLNRRVFEERLGEELRRARRYDRPLSLIMADLDHFKVYNDTHGHPAGDVILQELATILLANVRDTDLVARYGGEEFVVLLPETPRVGAQAVAEKIRAAVENHPFPQGETQPDGRLTISLGVATFPKDLDAPEALVRRADEALYRAKEMGRNRVCAGSS